MAEPLIATGYALAGLLSVGLAWRCLRNRPRPGALWLAVVLAGVTWWSVHSLGLALLDAPGTPLAILVGRLEWFGIATIAVGIVRVGLALSGRDDSLSTRGVLALLAVPYAWSLVGLARQDVVALVGEWHPILGDALATLSPLVPLYVRLTPYVIAGIYVALALGMVLLLETAFERPAAGPRRLLTLLMVLPPWVLNVFYLTGITPNAGYDPTVLGFVVTGVAGTTLIERYRLFETPLARSEVVEELDTPILVFGADGRLYDYNDRAVDVLGIDEAFVDRPIETALAQTPLSIEVSADALTENPPDELDGAEATVPLESLDGGDDATGENADESAADGPRHYLVTTTDLGGRKDADLGYAVQLSDVTRQRRQQERIRDKSTRLEQKNEQLERLAGIVAHDMQSPVATGQRLLDLLRMDVGAEGDGAEIAQSLDDLERVLDRLEEFTEHIPQLARESVDVDAPVECDLEEVAREAWAVVETGDLVLDVRESTTLRGDPRRLQQALENLVRNAVEHGSTGPRSSSTREDAGEQSSPSPRSAPPHEDAAGASSSEPSVADERSSSSSASQARQDADALEDAGEQSSPSPRSAPPHEDAAEHASAGEDVTGGDGASVLEIGVLASDGEDPHGFYVADDGPGIPADRREDVFAFGDGDGTGYGLAIVRTIVEAHGWSITATDAPGGGARFDVTWPRQ